MPHPVPAAAAGAGHSPKYCYPAALKAAAAGGGGNFA
jgi:hypothetical protein